MPNTPGKPLPMLLDDFQIAVTNWLNAKRESEADTSRRIMLAAREQIVLRFEALRAAAHDYEL